jgi:hypothetical protein
MYDPDKDDLSVKMAYERALDSASRELAVHILLYKTYGERDNMTPWFEEIVDDIESKGVPSELAVNAIESIMVWKDIPEEWRKDWETYKASQDYIEVDDDAESIGKKSVGDKEIEVDESDESVKNNEPESYKESPSEMPESIIERIHSRRKPSSRSRKEHSSRKNANIDLPQEKKPIKPVGSSDNYYLGMKVLPPQINGGL